jgi:hypothetical protein
MIKTCIEINGSNEESIDIIILSRKLLYLEEDSYVLETKHRRQNPVDAGYVRCYSRSLRLKIAFTDTD